MAETFFRISAETPGGTQYTFDVPPVAAEYSSSATYAVGDYCTYQGQMYRCTTAISSAEAWTAAHWTAVTVGEELNSTVQKITLAELATITSGVYTLGEVTVSDSTQLPRQDMSGVRIVDTVFNINTSVLFTRWSGGGYQNMPEFVGCTFNNVLNAKTTIIESTGNVVGLRFTACKFNNVDCVNSAYVQDASFVNCQIRAYECFVEVDPTTYTSGSVQARFVNCDVEAQDTEIINTTGLFLYMSGTYEGNGNYTNGHYYINAVECTAEFNSCWFETVKLLNLTGGTSATARSTITLSGCLASLNSTPMVSVTNPDYVNFYIIGSRMAPYDSNSVFVNQPADAFENVIGRFERSANTSAHPFNGVDAEEKQIATVEQIDALETYVNNLDASRFGHGDWVFSSSVISAGTGLTLTLPLGKYLFVCGGNTNTGRWDQTRMFMVTTGRYAANATGVSIMDLAKSNTSTNYSINTLSFSGVKDGDGDTTFTLTITTSSTTAASLQYCWIRLE